MNLSTETRSHKNNTSTIQTRTTQKPKQTYNEKNKTSTQTFTKMKLKTWDMRWGNESPYLFLEDLEVKSAKIEVVKSDTECLGEFKLREKVNSHKMFKGKLKRFWKTDFETQNMRFSRLGWVTNKSPGQAAKTLKVKLWKKFLSVFCD